MVTQVVGKRKKKKNINQLALALLLLCDLQIKNRTDFVHLDLYSYMVLVPNCTFSLSFVHGVHFGSCLLSNLRKLSAGTSSE